MSAVSLVVVLVGAVVTVLGIVQFREPWARYRALKAQESNIARYEAWRGGLRDSGPTGASVAMDLFRARARNAALGIATGVAVVLVGLFVVR